MYVYIFEINKCETWVYGHPSRDHNYEDEAAAWELWAQDTLSS